jgi:hypothetical protein
MRRAAHVAPTASVPWSSAGSDQRAQKTPSTMAKLTTTAAAPS